MTGPVEGLVGKHHLLDRPPHLITIKIIIINNNKKSHFRSCGCLFKNSKCVDLKVHYVVFGKSDGSYSLY